ncbi:MAG: gephyrin-like molybdotransferase Glp [Gammaproteobacteria bacterium]|nr:gephyrin-like molybdotransferase Glp [Gammaproteobacteria bacterium]
MNDTAPASPAPPKPVGLDEARAAMLEGLASLPGTEILDIGATLKRVLAAPLVSAIDVPEFDNSAMDGYAVCSGDISGDVPIVLDVSQHIRAGDRAEPLTSGTAARIFTGAPLPEGADAVVMQEECERDGDRVRLHRAVKAGEHIRPRAHDIARGAVVLPAGHRMRPQDVAIAAATGTRELRVRRRPRVAIFSTGDELVLPGRDLEPGHRYTANNHLLAALLQAAGAEVTDAGIIPDDLDATCDKLVALARDHDLLLSSGGASVGDEDHVHRALGRVGEVALWRIAVRPGKPLLFGRLESVLFLGLPGNPVSTFVTFLLLVRPLVLALQGATALEAPRLMVRAGFDWPEPGSRREFVRVRVDSDAGGATIARLYPDQSSDVLSSAVWADGLVEIPPGKVLSRGDQVGYVPFTGLID